MWIGYKGTIRKKGQYEEDEVDQTKKMLTVLLTATAAMAVTPMAGYAETVQTKQIVNQSSEATVEVLSGNCGPVDEEGNFTESTKWSLEKNSEAEEFYTLRISGNGRMADFTINNTEDNRPWKDYLDSIKKVEMESGITSIGSMGIQQYDKFRGSKYSS